MLTGRKGGRMGWIARANGVAGVRSAGLYSRGGLRHPLKDPSWSLAVALSRCDEHGTYGEPGACSPRSGNAFLRRPRPVRASCCRRRCSPLATGSALQPSGSASPPATLAGNRPAPGRHRPVRDTARERRRRQSRAATVTVQNILYAARHDEPCRCHHPAREQPGGGHRRLVGRTGTGAPGTGTPGTGTPGTGAPVTTAPPVTARACWAPSTLTRLLPGLPVPTNPAARPRGNSMRIRLGTARPRRQRRRRRHGGDAIAHRSAGPAGSGAPEAHGGAADTTVAMPRPRRRSRPSSCARWR